MYLDHDWQYLLAALQLGGACIVSNPVHRASLKRLGYMLPCKPRNKRWEWKSTFHMALTKIGQQRALKIAQQKDAENEARKHRTRGARTPLVFTGRVGRVAKTTIPLTDRYRITGSWR